jgi:hypothetical protein
MKINSQKGICASRWSFTKNHYMMHGQQNVKENKETRYEEDGNINGGFTAIQCTLSHTFTTDCVKSFGNKNKTGLHRN